MCGRVVCYSPLEEISEAIGATLDPSAQYAYHPSYNVPPSQPVPIVCDLEQQSEQDAGRDSLRDGNADRRLLMAKWGLLPHWAKDESLAFKTFNARAETVREKPAFRGAFKYRRCIVSVNGYYEWRRQGNKKQPFYFSRQDGDFVRLAGLFEFWKDELLTCTVITTAASDMAAEVHSRMPVVIEPQDTDTWLNASPDEAYEVLHSAGKNVLKMYEVDPAVNNAQHDGSELITPFT